MLTRLSRLRKSKKWSLQYTADRLGIAKSTYAGYESGYREPPLETLKKLADLLETSVDYLLGRIDNPAFYPKAWKVELHDKLKLTEARRRFDVELILDGAPLNEEEIKQCIAFIRTKRKLDTNA